MSDVYAQIAQGVNPLQMANQVMQYRTAQQQLATQQFQLQQARLQPAYAGLNALLENPNADWNDVNRALANSARLGADISPLTAAATDMAAQGGTPGNTPADFIRQYGTARYVPPFEAASLFLPKTTLQNVGPYEVPFNIAAPGSRTPGMMTQAGPGVPLGLSPSELNQQITIPDPTGRGGPIVMSTGEAIRRGLWNPGMGVYGYGDQGVGGGSGVPPPRGQGVEKAAASSDLAALPDVQALPAAIQGPLVNAMVNAGLGPQAGAQYARMIRQESRGQMLGPSGQPLVSSAGARGVAQVMPDTFNAMASQYGIQGGIDDVNANLNAGARYFRQGLDLTNGDLAGAAVYYNAGPRGLASYAQGGALPAETVGYLRNTRAPAPGSYQVASNAPVAPPGGAAGGGFYGQGGGVIATPAPGAVEAAKTAAAGSVGRQQALEAQMNRSIDTRATLQGMEADLNNMPTSGVTAGPLGTLKNAIISSGLATQQTVDSLSQSLSAQEQFDKFSSMLNQQLLQGMGGQATDARQELTGAATPSSIHSKLGNLGIIHMLEGNISAVQVMGRMFQQDVSKGLTTPAQFDQWRNNFTMPTKDGARFDPRIFWIANMGAQEQQDYVNSLTPKDKAQLLKNANYAEQQGWVYENPDHTMGTGF